MPMLGVYICTHGCTHLYTQHKPHSCIGTMHLPTRDAAVAPTNSEPVRLTRPSGGLDASRDRALVSLVGQDHWGAACKTVQRDPPAIPHAAAMTSENG